ncbi:DUF411 domain-containing protein, partial [Acinetobacter baumannii]
MSELLRRRAALLLPAALALAASPGRRRAQAAPAASPLRVMRSPGCGCCEGWADHLRAAGFAVEMRDTPDLDAAR